MQVQAVANDVLVEVYDNNSNLVAGPYTVTLGNTSTVNFSFTAAATQHQIRITNTSTPGNYNDFIYVTAFNVWENILVPDNYTITQLTVKETQYIAVPDVFNVSNLSVTATPYPDVAHVHQLYVSYAKPYTRPLCANNNDKLEGVNKYRFGFNGKERDDETYGDGNEYDYGFRIYNPRIGKFLSVDPLCGAYPHYSTYQFAGNMPIAAIDLDGLEQKIEIYQDNKDGTSTIVRTIEYKEVKEYGPLGNGVYTVHLKQDGTYNEKYTPGDNNSIPPFEAEKISQNRWKNDMQKYGGFESRLNARLLEGTVENGLIGLGFDKEKVRKDVSLYESDDNFKDHFVSLNNAADYINSAAFDNGDADFYTSVGHASKNSYTSCEIGNSNVCVKIYDGAKSQTDKVMLHVGLVQEGPLDHTVNDYIRGLNSKNNIDVDNAQILKSYEENNKAFEKVPKRAPAPADKTAVDKTTNQ